MHMIQNLNVDPEFEAGGELEVKEEEVDEHVTDLQFSLHAVEKNNDVTGSYGVK